jgi:serine/threonine protein kinase
MAFILEMNRPVVPGIDRCMRSTVSSVMLPKNLEGLVLENDLKLLRLLGEGGMDVVYEGRQLVLGRSVCVKFLRSELLSNEEHFRRFQREGKVMSGLTSDGVARIYAIGRYLEVFPYIVMELVEGSTLRDLIFVRKMSPEEVCRLFIQVCRSLSAVHEQGFMHRDLKPENLIVRETSDGFDVKILDFGLCGLLQGRDESVTRTAEVLGSYLYMAPECFISTQHSPAVDIYAIGCIIYEVLAGTPPFSSGDLALVAQRHSRSSFPKLPGDEQDSSRSLIPALQAILEKACSKNAQARFKSTEEFAVCLEDALAGRSPPSSESAAPISRRITIGFLAVVALVSLIALPVKEAIFGGKPDEIELKSKLGSCRNAAARVIVYRDFLSACNSRKELSCDWSQYQIAFDTVFWAAANAGDLENAFDLCSKCFFWVSRRSNAELPEYQKLCILKADCALALGRSAESQRCIELLSLKKLPKQFDVPRWVRANLILARSLARQNKGEQAVEVLNHCLCQVKVPLGVEGELRLTLTEVLLELKRAEEARIEVKKLNSAGWRPVDGWDSASASFLGNFYKTQWLGSAIEHFELNGVYYLTRDQNSKAFDSLRRALSVARDRSMVHDASRLQHWLEELCGTADDPLAVHRAVPALVWQEGTLVKSPSISRIDKAIQCLKRLGAPLNFIADLQLRKAQCLIHEEKFKEAKELARRVMSEHKESERMARIIIRHCDEHLQSD